MLQQKTEKFFAQKYKKQTVKKINSSGKTATALPSHTANAYKLTKLIHRLFVL